MKLLTSQKLFVYIDMSLPLTLTCYASAYGIRVVLAQQGPDRCKRLISMHHKLWIRSNQITRNLRKKVYRISLASNTTHTCLGILSYLLKTSQYLYLCEHKSSLPQASGIIHRWLLYLSNSQCSLKFKNTMSMEIPLLSAAFLAYRTSI